MIKKVENIVIISYKAMKSNIKKISIYRSSSLTIRLIGFMIVIAIVLLISFSVPVLRFLNSTNDDNRHNLSELNASYVEILTQSTLEQISSAAIDSNVIAAVVTPDSDSSKKQSMAQVSLSRLNSSDIYTDELALFISDSRTIVTSAYDFGTPESKSFEYAAYFLDNIDRLDTIRTDSHHGYIFRYGSKLYMALEFPQSGNKRLGIIFAKLNEKLFTDRISFSNGNDGGCFILGRDNSVFVQTGNIRDYSDFASEIPDYEADSRLSWSDSRYSYTVSPIGNTSMRVLNADSATYGNTFRTLLQLLLPVSLMVIADFIFLIILFNDKFIQPLHRINKSLSGYIDKSSSSEDISSGDQAAQNEFSDIEESVSKLINTHREQGETLETVKDELLDRLLTELLSGSGKPHTYYEETLSGMHAPIDAAGSYCLLALTPDNAYSGSLDTLLKRTEAALSESTACESFSFVCIKFGGGISVLLEFSKNTAFVEASETALKIRDSLAASRSPELFFDIKLSDIYGRIEDTSYIYSSMFDKGDETGSLYGQDYFIHKTDEAVELILSDSAEAAAALLIDVLKEALGSCRDAERPCIASCYVQAVSDKLKMIPSSLHKNADETVGAEKISGTTSAGTETASAEVHEEGSDHTAVSGIGNNIEVHNFNAVTDSGSRTVSDMPASEQTEAELIAFTKRACLSLQLYYERRKNKYVAASIEYVEKHYQEPELSLERTAEALGIHFNYLSRVFKANMGESFTSYVGRYRIDKAKALLGGSKLKISEIASVTGFGSQQNFTKVFKKYELITPGRYREQRQKNDA